MTRKITMLGSNAQYIEHRGNSVSDDDREIVMEGDHARYEEIQQQESPHFPLINHEEKGRQLYELLIKGQFIEGDTSLACWLYMMGYSNVQPACVKPIVWLKTKEAAQVMLRGVYASLIAKNELTVARLFQLTEQCFATPDGKPLKLAKPRKELSHDIDLLNNFFRPEST